ncbi:hypothetical protein JW905_18005, partial [bacterium]|nr:hypothetical protein [candidate division CSSED10-310 bacterium]
AAGLLIMGMYLLAPWDNHPTVIRTLTGGFMLGAALLCSYRLLVFLPLPWIIGAAGHLRRGDLRALANFSASYWCGAAIPVLGTEGIYRLLIQGPLLRYESNSYFLFMIRKLAVEGHWDMSHPWFYPDLLWRMDGPALVLLWGAGMMLILCSRRRSDRYLLLNLFFPALVFTFSSTRLTRAISFLIPLLALCAGSTLAGLQKRLRGPLRWVVPMIVLLVCAVSLPRCRDLTRLRSGYAEAMTFLGEQPHRHFSTMKPVSAVYFGPDNGFYPPPSVTALEAAAAEHDCRYLLVDWQKYVWYHDSIKYIEERFLPVKVILNPYVKATGVMNENYLPDDAPRLLALDHTIGLIKIYDLWAIFPELRGKPSVGSDLETTRDTPAGVDREPDHGGMKQVDFTGG